MRKRAGEAALGVDKAVALRSRCLLAKRHPNPYRLYQGKIAVKAGCLHSAIQLGPITLTSLLLNTAPQLLLTVQRAGAEYKAAFHHDSRFA